MLCSTPPQRLIFKSISAAHLPPRPQPSSWSSTSVCVFLVRRHDSAAQSAFPGAGSSCCKGGKGLWALGEIFRRKQWAVACLSREEWRALAASFDIVLRDQPPCNDEPIERRLPCCPLAGGAGRLRMCERSGSMPCVRPRCCECDALPCIRSAS
jgi:hypothetical protein